VATVILALALAEPPDPLAVIVYVVEAAGVTFVEPCALTVPTSGAMVSCVASVEVQLSVDESPFSTALGLASRVTVGWAAAGAGGAVGGAVTCLGFLLHPNAKTEAASSTNRLARCSDRETSIIQILLKK
jgi:hypothetical protein